jgi:hypothetical protein
MKTAVIVDTMRPRGRPGPCEFRLAFGSGLERHGWHVRHTVGDAEPCDLLVLWGVRQRQLIERQKARGGQVCILERGYVGDRFRWTSVSFGGALNGCAEFRGPLHDPSRWNVHFADLMQPWRQKPDGVALIMGQVQGDQSLRGVNINAFYSKALEAFTRIGVRIRFRPHPHRRTDCRPLADDLADAACVVTYNSNSAVDAVLAGVPTIAVDRGSMAWDVTGHELGQMPPAPPRNDWATALAWKQWLPEEMASGDCWQAVGTGDARWAA